MPLFKANEPLGPRPVIIAWYGDPGIGKTSLFNTCRKPLLIDGDRGVSRSANRKDTLIPDSWDEVLKHEKDGEFKGYATIGIDTPKAILDDFLMSYVVNKDYKLRTNKLGAYGAIGDEFKLFLNNRRLDQADIAIICHSRKDEDAKRMIPDVTGQSLNLIMRIADMIGYYTMINGRRVLAFDPTESTFGKNVAKIPPIEVPDTADPAYKTFMADIFERVRTAIASQSEEQVEAMKRSQEFQELISAAADADELEVVAKQIADMSDTDLPAYLRLPLEKLIDQKASQYITELIAASEDPDTLTAILEEVNKMPDASKVPLRKIINEKAKSKGYIPNVQTKRFELPADKPAAQTPQQQSAAQENKNEEPTENGTGSTLFTTPFDDRIKALDGLGMRVDADQVSGFNLTYTMEQVADWTEDEYIDIIALVNAAKKANKPKATGTGSRSRTTAPAR